MTPIRFRQVRNVFEAALEREPPQRSAFVRDAAKDDMDLLAQVDRMLEAHEQTVTFLDGGASAPEELRTDPRRLEGRRLGAYEILREIGRGGMGTVYLARRADGLFEQQVAIKVVTPESAGREVIQRFEQERAILASLEHPNIARLYDGGATTEGWPYFVMEYVDGKPIDQWCDERKLNVSDRVRLFSTVCGAVQYALEHRVIHRDLKPGNILITRDGTVKLLDFGIAKLVRVDAEEKTVLATRTGMRLMTPEYASPEQIRAEEVTPLSDLYSLGVILYELLTGRRPYRLKSRVFHEIVRVVCEEPPTRPSTVVTEDEERPGEAGKTITIAPGLLSQSREGTPLDLKRRLTGDLDGIVLKALEKDPRERYRSVEQFRMDIERHLKGETVLVSKSGRLSDVLRVASNYKVSIVIAAAIFLAFLSGGVQIEWRAIATAGAVLAVVGLWHISTDRNIGAKISGTASGGVFLLFLVLVVLAVAMQVTRFFFPAWSGSHVLNLVCALGYGVVFLHLAGVVIAWPSRGRWAGSLAFSMKSMIEAQWVSIIFLAPSVYSNIRRIFPDRDPSFDYYVAVAMIPLLFVAVLYFWIVTRVVEVRDRGLLVNGHLFSWLSIERYEWEMETNPRGLTSLNLNPRRKAVLRLHVSRLFSFLPSPRVRIPADQQQALESILKRHLSDWPSQ